MATPHSAGPRPRRSVPSSLPSPRERTVSSCRKRSFKGDGGDDGTERRRARPSRVGSCHRLPHHRHTLNERFQLHSCGKSAMPKRNDLTISKRTVDMLSVEGKDAVFWDHDLPGFGVRVYPTAERSTLCKAGGPGGPKRVTLGRTASLPPIRRAGRRLLSSTVSKAARTRFPHRLRPHSP